MLVLVRSQLILLSSVLLFLAPAASAADLIPEVMLKADYDQCVVQVRRNAHISRSLRQAYCSCVKDEIRVKYDLEAYMSMTIALQNGDLSSDGIKQLSSIAASCAGKSFN